MLRKILKKLSELKIKRQNCPVVLFNGEHSYESSLVMRVCELENVADDALDMLAKIAASYGFGEEHEKIVDLLSRYAQYNESALNMVSKGTDWGERGDSKEKKIKETYSGNIFGLTQDEIASKQGINKLK